MNVARTTRDGATDSPGAKAPRRAPRALSVGAARRRRRARSTRARRRKGLRVVQDEASQLVALVVDQLAGAPARHVRGSGEDARVRAARKEGPRGGARRGVGVVCANCARARRERGEASTCSCTMPRAGTGSRRRCVARPRRACSSMRRAAGSRPRARKPDLARRVDLDVLRRLPEQQLGNPRAALSQGGPMGG